ncbi:Ca(2+)-dependent cysteine protease [Coemansia sp. RSA 2706]|nr:Ca(2+)-dependent cysteine protease [Coemansia sp. RSA 2708]KAJ2306927.1 Ca(2+)-dependent cysteine protease [Coemansia sp. RSA 2706]KAJ2311985.1 Ca(2+)-dependent cysteine protease [Coemansia sp. RSA 2705]KAJ2319344.1 Ca(2+)-dependent cysteine protease [Coemansia sp. RSA 2704]KAJ2328607.1 Ca(2+)-dependent cysteine protease [Coemansia sp. RSA 2702]KAJ2737106.1 Ca(2+)-dependent cysteine protease [Coemansia sp. Cherry 401B]
MNSGNQGNYGNYQGPPYGGGEYSQQPPGYNYGGDYNGPPPMDGGYDYQGSRGFDGGASGGDDYYSSRQMPRPPPNGYPGNAHHGGPPPNDNYGPQGYNGGPAPFPGGGSGSFNANQGYRGEMPFPGAGFPGGSPQMNPMPPPQRSQGGGGYGMPGGGYESSGGYNMPGNGNYGPPPGGDPYGPPSDNYGPPGNNNYGPPGGNYGPPGGNNYGPPGGNNYGPPGGNNYGPPDMNSYGGGPGDFGMAPPMNMPVVRHRPEDIDFAGANFPQWHSQPTPPPPPAQPNHGINVQGQPTHGNIPTYSIPQEMQQEGSKVTLSNCRGRKRALLIGINYIGTKHMLKGCINDVLGMKKFIIEHFGFREEDMVILTDNQRNNPRRLPTHENILKAMKWLVSDARMNDSFFFHYSGHGITVESEQSEEIDGKDEAICPMDFESKGTIVDDDMNAIMVHNLPRGSRLTAIFDCCHSATALDLPFMYNHMGKLKNEKAITYAGKGIMAAGNMYLKGDMAGALKGLVKSVDMAITGDSKLDKSRRTKSTMGDVIMFSGCKDDQTSADTKTELAFTGAMSHALITSMNSNPRQTYVQLLQDIRRRLAPKYTQVPQLSTGRLMDMNTIFIM